MDDMKQEYKKLIATGMFWELFPFLSGNWEDDKDIFMELIKDKLV